jgi:L-rhamnose mutarotase
LVIVRKSGDRACFVLKVRADRLDEYRADHERVWPEFLVALRAAGWRDYSTFLRADGLVVGYFESDDTAAAMRAMADTEINAKWQSAMAKYFEQPDGGTPELLPEVFNLDAQLSASTDG